MAIRKIIFEVCTNCGETFRFRERLGGRILCDACAGEVIEAAEAKRRAEAGEEEEDWRIEDRRRRPVGGGAGGEGSGEEGDQAGRMKRMAEAGPLVRPPGEGVEVSIRVHRAVILGMFGVIVTITGLSVWQLRQLAAPRPDRLLGARPVLRPLPKDDPLLTVLPDFQRSLAVARGFLAAQDVDSILPWIRDGELVRALVEQSLPTRPPTLEARDRLQQLPPMVEGHLAYQCFGLIFRSGDGRMVPVVPTPRGPKVDYKAFLEWSDAPFDDLAAGKVREAQEMRLMVRRSVYYNYTFSDQEKYAAFDASPGRGGGSVTLYAERGSEIEQRLNRALVRMSLQPATVSLAAVDGSEGHRQFLITRLRALGFVVPDGS